MRVISGEARGHTLKAPKGMTTRPMADKIKGAVFSMLSNLLSQTDREWGRILDLYAGTGSIGIESLSRGAEWADFVEINAGVCRIISDNLAHTKMDSKARVNHRAVHAFLNSPPPAPGTSHPKRAYGGLHRRKGGDPLPKDPLPDAAETPSAPESDNNTIHNEQQYDIIFLDPPYADPKINNTLAHVARSGLVKPGGLVVIGHSPRVTLQTSYGDGEVGSQFLQLLRHRRHGDSAFTIFLAGDLAFYGFAPQSDTQLAATDLEDTQLEEQP